jgi:hypothetical protein
MLRSDLKMAWSAIRCPFCHGDLEPAREEWVACRSCVARHHLACWAERGACSSCGERAHLFDARPSTFEVDVKRLANEAELARLDREWETEKVAFCTKLRDGRVITPGPWDAFGTWVVATIAAVVVLVLLASPVPQGAFVPFLIAVFAVVGALESANRWDAFSRAAGRYKARREALVLENVRIAGRS